LGLEIAKNFHEKGASLVILDREQSLLDELKKTYPSWTVVKVDLLDWEATRKTLSEVQVCHHIVNNAGVNARQDLLDITSENVDL
jgi:NADP-dependent 3-hydroxy acid dehydrogenase YdfG